MQERIFGSNFHSILLSIWLFLAVVFSVLPGYWEKSSRATACNERMLSDGITSAEIPKIGDIVTTDRALRLCEHYGLRHLAERIRDNPDLFKEWEFDGCSMTSDEVVSELIHVPSLTEICLRHDLGYAYGEPGNEEERLIVDRKFQNELLGGGASEFAATVMFDAVRVGGKEKFCFPFSWGFARVGSCRPGLGLKSRN